MAYKLRETLFSKTRWKVTEEDTRCQPLAPHIHTSMQSCEQDLKLGEKSIKQTQTTWHSWRGGFRSYKPVTYGQIMIEMATVVQVWFSANASVPGGPSVPRGQNKDTLWTFHAPGITPIGICLFSISISGLHVSFLGRGDYPDNCAAVQTYPQRL